MAGPRTAGFQLSTEGHGIRKRPQPAQERLESISSADLLLATPDAMVRFASSLAPGEEAVPHPPINRPISSAEAELIRWLLQNAMLHGSRPDLEARVGELQVVRLCECGCPTVGFDGPAEEATVLADARGMTSDGILVGVLLFGTSQTITALEIYTADDRTATLPVIATLERGWTS